jgi:hypothetical protein
MEKPTIMVLEYENGFVHMVQKVGIAQGGGAFLKQEIALMLEEELKENNLTQDDFNVMVVKIDRTETLKEHVSK